MENLMHFGFIVKKGDKFLYIWNNEMRIEECKDIRWEDGDKKIKLSNGFWALASSLFSVPKEFKTGIISFIPSK